MVAWSLYSKIVLKSVYVSWVLGSSAEMLINPCLCFLQLIWTVTSFRHFNGTHFPWEREPSVALCVKGPGLSQRHSDESTLKPLIVSLKSSDRGLSLLFVVYSQMLSAANLDPWSWTDKLLQMCRNSWDCSYSILRILLSGGSLDLWVVSECFYWILLPKDNLYCHFKYSTDCVLWCCLML